MKLFSSKRRSAIVGVAALLALFLVRPGVSPLKARIANSLSRAVARPVEVSSVHLRFLPPGFDLENLVIHEDPAFGAEPMLRASEVTATVRLTFLLRGRLDIARLELTEPSLNLVRRADGRWNWEALLERTAHTPLAPTAKSKSEARPSFPYIEATAGRVNFKSGPEKKPYALLNADFAVWQDSENAWGMRLKAQPLRTDMSLSDTGLLQMNGIWQRSGSLRETPLQFTVEWDRTQLGQLTKLVTGNDKGWRGEVHLAGTMAGTPAALKIAGDVTIQNFHRYDISSSEGLRLAAHCDGIYSSLESVVRNIFCSAPVGEGTITLRGDAGLPGVHRVNLLLNLESVPVDAVAQLARRAKKNLPPDLVATGSVEGNFTVKQEAASAWGPGFEGRGEIHSLHLQSAKTKVEFSPGNVPFSLSAGRNDAVPLLTSKFARQADNDAMPGPHIDYGPFAMPLGRPLPAQAKGWVARSGFSMNIHGDAEVSHALRVAGLFGLPAVNANVEGVAQMDLKIAGSWAGNIAATQNGFSQPDITGTVQLHNVRVAVREIKGPLEIASAELKLLPDGVLVDKLNARAADARWTGSLSLPRGCGMPEACLVRLNLNTERVEVSNLRDWFGAHPAQHRWYELLSSPQTAAPSFLQNLRASGKVSASRLLVRSLVAENVSAFLDLDRGNLQLSNLRGDLLGGRHRGDWQLDFSTQSPVYSGNGSFTGVSLSQLADAMNDSWISGTAAGTYRLTASAADPAMFWESAAGEMQFDVRNASLPHILLTDDHTPLSATRWQGRARLREAKILIQPGTLASPTGSYELSGTASLGLELDLKLIGGELQRTGAVAYGITGTLSEPHVVLTPLPETRAQLKP